MQKVRCSKTTAPYTKFQVLFTPRSGFFSPFPRGTSPLSITVHIKARRWSSFIQANLHEFRSTTFRKKLLKIGLPPA